jgi:uncharacterized membrane protein YjgN (DUF898 family)
MSSMQDSAALQQMEPASREERFVFTATGGEYSRIWIVNILLTVVTLASTRPGQGAT